MDVSQLCSNKVEEIPPTSLQNNGESSKSENPTQQRNPSNLQFLLSPSEDTHKTDANNNPSDNLTSIEQILLQCSKLCENIWQLKLQNKTLAENERNEMIDDLSNSAKSVFKAIQSTKEWASKDNSRKRDSNNFNNTYDTHLEDDEDEDEDLDEDGEDSKEANNNFNDYAEYELIRQARNIQNNQSRSKYRRRNRRNMIGQKCHSCGTTETPEWRRGPDGARTLCNACGLHYSKLLKKGSIAVQTQNYLLTGGSPQISQSNDTISKLLKGNSSPFKSIEAPPKSVTNFPFVMMDPKYGFVEKKNDYSTLRSNLQQQQQQQQPLPPPLPVPHSFDTPNQLSPIYSRNTETNPSFVNSNNNSNFDNDTSRHLDSRASISSSSSNNSNSLTPLRIHQWKKNH